MIGGYTKRVVKRNLYASARKAQSVAGMPRKKSGRPSNLGLLTSAGRRRRARWAVKKAWRSTTSTQQKGNTYGRPEYRSGDWM